MSCEPVTPAMRQLLEALTAWPDVDTDDQRRRPEWAKARSWSIEERLLMGDRSVPYSSITMFSKESAGVLDLDADLKIWVRGFTEPIQFSFNKDAPINDVYQLLGSYLLEE